ncbi:MAG TPA: ATP-binding protein, partial [Capillimicrobium sp.]
MLAGIDGPLERGAELRALRAAAAQARAGTGATVLVEGPAGIGKSRLLATLRAEAPAGGLAVRQARGAQLERDYPFGVVRQLLAPALEGRSSGERDRLLAGPVEPARALFEAPGRAVAAEAVDDGYDVLHALWLLVARLAEADGPLALLLDDAHWADTPSLRFAVFLAHRVDALPVLLALAGRPPAEWGAPELRTELAADPALPVLRPATLSAAAARELARDLLGDPRPGFADACHAASGGNPFYLRELLRAGAGAGPQADPSELGPEAVRRSVHARLRRLGDDADAFARAASILGDGTATGTVAALAGLPLDRALAAADALRAVEILDPAPAVGFAHPILRTVVADLQLAGERAAAHARAAELLAADGAPADVVAAQVLQAAPAADPARVAVLRAAAAQAARRGAPDVAAVLLRRALDEPPPAGERAAVLLETGLAEALARDRRAREHLVEAIERAASPDDRLRAAVALWTSDSFDGRYDDGMALLQRALTGADG